MLLPAALQPGGPAGEGWAGGRQGVWAQDLVGTVRIPQSSMHVWDSRMNWKPPEALAPVPFQD